MNYATQRLRAAAEASLAAWEDEEQSVREEHREVIEELESALHYFEAHGETQADAKLNALRDCVDQMEQCESMFRNDREFMAALNAARAAV